MHIPFAGEWLTSNPSSTGNRYGRSRAIKAWRETTALICRAHRLPTGITPVTIQADIYYVRRRPVRDKLNLAPTIKAIVDGLTPPKVWTRGGRQYRTLGHGFLPDDSDKHVLATTWDLHPAQGLPCVELTIREAPDER